MIEPLIIVAPNGARKQKKEFPNLPITPEELAQEAVRCVEAGASIFHLHVRELDGAHSLNPEYYRQALAAIREKIGNKMILQVTTEAVGKYTPPEQMAVVRELVPEAVSLGLKELVPDVQHEAKASDFFHWLHQQPTQVQYILYHPQEVYDFAALMAKGVIPSHDIFLLFVLGNKQGQFGFPQDLAPFVEALRQSGLNVQWAMCASDLRIITCSQTAPPPPIMRPW